MASLKDQPFKFTHHESITRCGKCQTALTDWWDNLDWLCTLTSFKNTYWHQSKPAWWTVLIPLCGLVSHLPSHPPFVSLPPAEFSRESLLEAAGGLECPLSKEKEDCSSVANVADPSSQQNNAQAGIYVKDQGSTTYAGIFPSHVFASGESSSSFLQGRVYLAMLNSSTGLA